MAVHWKEIAMVTLEDAKNVIDAAERKATEFKQPMNIAVADAGGKLIAHLRMDDAWGTIAQRVQQILRVPEVDCAVDCVGFEAKGKGGEGEPATVLNQLMEATCAAGAIGISGLYVTEDPGAGDRAATSGNLSIHLGLGWQGYADFDKGAARKFVIDPRGSLKKAA
jgi:threonine dehydrogenase-like Zn-dependent dehydrogenase